MHYLVAYRVPSRDLVLAHNSIVPQVSQRLDREVSAVRATAAIATPFNCEFKPSQASMCLEMSAIPAVFAFARGVPRGTIMRMSPSMLLAKVSAQTQREPRDAWITSS